MKSAGDAKAAAARSGDWTTLGLGIILAAAAIAAYSRTFSVPLLFDDPATIAQNLSIRHWSTAWQPPNDTTAAGRPILNLTLALNYAISGTAVWSYHVLNLAIHILAGLALFGIVRRTLRLGPRDAPGQVAAAAAPTDGGAAPALLSSEIAFAAALLWLLHPLQTESVTYIVQRAESLMGLFYLLTLYCFIRYVKRDSVESLKDSATVVGQVAGFGSARNRGGGLQAFDRILWASLSVFGCLLGMATKEVMVSAPLIVFLYDRTFVSGSFGRAWRRHRGLYAAFAATWLVLPLLTLPTHGRGGTAGFDSGVSWWSYFITQFPAILRYLKLAVWPSPLVFYYGTEWVRDFRTVLPGAAVVIALAAATVAGLVSSRRGGRLLGFAGIWFFAILAPTSLIPINRQTAAEHRMYLALVPLVVAAAVGIFRLLGRRGLPACLALAAVFFALTFRRNGDYRSALVLWTKTVADCPQNGYARGNLACELANLPGRNADAMAQAEEALRLTPDDPGAHNNLGYILEKIPARRSQAMAQYEEALQLDPNFAEAHNNLGYVLEKTPGRLPDAVAQYEAALRLKPGLAEAHYNLGHALEKMPGRLDDALAEYEEALRLNPDYVEASDSLAYALNAAGRTAEATARYEAALRLNPGAAEVHNNLGNILSGEGRTAEAVAEYEAAVRLKPDYADAHYNLANALKRVRTRWDEAMAEYEKALSLKPDNAGAHNNLGNLLRARGRTAEAIVQYEDAVRLDPDIAEAHNNLGNLLSDEGRTVEAIAQYEEALRLKPDDPAAHFNLALALIATPGRAGEAVPHLEATLRLQPGNARVRKILDRMGVSPP